MLGWISIVGLYGLSALFIVLRKVYMNNPKFDKPAALKSRSIKSTKREHVLSLLLATISAGLFAGATILLAEYSPAIISLPLAAFLLIYIYFVIPRQRASGLMTSLSYSISPLFISILNKTKPYTKEIEKNLNAYEAKRTLDKPLSRAEILAILESQKSISEGRSLSFELAAGIKMIELIAKKAEDFMLKIDEVHLVGDKESVGPILIDELHKSKRRLFLVNNKEHGIIGTVGLKDLVELTNGGKVEKVFTRSVEFIEKDQDVREILETFVTTGQGIFVVTDDDGEKIGAVYIEDIIKELSVD